MKLYYIPVDTTVTIQDRQRFSSYLSDTEKFFQENDINSFDDECVSFIMRENSSIWSVRWKDVRVINN